MVFSPHWYDLRALFDKAFGDFTVNVQGLSRVSSPETNSTLVNRVWRRGCFRGTPSTGVKVELARTTHYRSRTLPKLGTCR
jgi:hypothetical protein